MVPPLSRGPLLHDVVASVTTFWLADLLSAMTAGLAALFLGADDAYAEAGVGR